MEKITLTFLGTSNAVPTKKRNHTAMLLTYKNESILIDCGEGTQRQFKFAEVSPNKLTRLLLTHWHGDHVLGIPGLLQTLAMNDYSRILPVHGPKGTERYFDALNQLFNLKVKTETSEGAGKIYENDEFYIEAEEMKHTSRCLAYAFVIKDKLRIDRDKLKKLKVSNSPELAKIAQGKDATIDGKKIKAKDLTYMEKGRKIVFILDTAPNAETIQIAKDADLLVCEASFTEEESDLAREKLHLTAKDAAEIAKKAKVKHLILTHISQRYEHNPQPILDEAKAVFKNVSLAKDLQVVEL